MAFEGLNQKLSEIFKKITSRGKLTEADVKAAMREVRLALLEADVNFAVVKEFIANLTERCVGSQVMESLTPGQQVIKIVNEELTALMGGARAKLDYAPNPPTVIMLCGLQGAGKTTMAAKLAKLMRERDSKRPMLAALDIYRPAAIKQLQVVGGQVGVPVFEMGTQDPVKTAKQALNEARRDGRDVLILDTAGRLHIDEELMDELKKLKRELKPDHILFVVDAMTGQDAVNAAKSFDEALDISGVILTKLDGDARGGAALSVRRITGKPIVYAGVGEKLDDIEPFHPDRMASRILGMGDVLTLIEKAQSSFDEKKAIELERKMKSASFTLGDFLDQFAQMEKMGGVSAMLSMLPGAGKINPDDVDEKQMSRMRAIIESMTQYERTRPEVLNASRKRRIAAGSGTQVQDVNRLLKQFEMSKKMMKQFSGKARRGMPFKLPF